MQTWADRELALLRQRFPGWDVWVVPVYLGPDVWAARPKGEPVARFNAASPGELESLIREQS